MRRVVVVDTDVISYMLKGHSWATKYESKLEGMQILLSFMTVAELRRWALRRKWGPQRYARFEERIKQSLILFADMQLCNKWAEVMMCAELHGRRISAQDAWIAATALQLDIPLVTNNLKDFEHIAELDLISAL